jgi:hypothetical protein
MLERLLSKLRPALPDPTREWPRRGIATLSVDTRRGTVGSLGFGSEIAAARVWGRPDSLRWTQPGYCELVYAAAGFQVDFDAGRLAYAAFFIAEDESLPTGMPVVFSTPIVDGTRLTSGMSAKRIEGFFGAPEVDDHDGDEWVLTYVRGAVTAELEGAAAGTLKRVNVYPTAAR